MQGGGCEQLVARLEMRRERAEALQVGRVRVKLGVAVDEERAPGWGCQDSRYMFQADSHGDRGRTSCRGTW